MNRDPKFFSTTRSAKKMSGEAFRPCGLCGKPATMMCARCLIVAFCDATCQRGAWRDHKRLCVSPPELPSESMDISRVVALMAAQRTDLKVIARGAIVIQLKSQAADGLQGALDAGALPVLVGALHDHASSAPVCRLAATVIINIFDLPGGRANVIASGALFPLIQALRTHAENEDICSLSSHAISLLCRDSSGGQIAPGSSEALLPLLATLRTHLHNEHICAMTSCAIVKIYEPGVEASVLKPTALPTLVAALQLHADCEAVCSNISGILQFLCDSPSSVDAILETEALPLLVAALRSHSGNQSLCIRAVGAVQRISCHPSGPGVAYLSSALPQLVAVLRIHKESALVSESAASAIFNIAGCPAGKTSAIALHAVEVLVSVHSLHGSGCKAFRALRRLGFSNKGKPL